MKYWRLIGPRAGLLFTACVLVSSAWAGAATGSRGMVTSVHPIATDAGVQAFQNGGNAIDAAVAVALTLGVVDGHNSGIGGGCFLLIRTANGEIAAIDGRETAPKTASRDMYLRNGKADVNLSQSGALASGIPGSLAAYDYAVQKFGRRTLKARLLAAAGVADGGFRIDASYAARLASVADDFRKSPDARRIFFDSKGDPIKAGALLQQPDLAKSYRKIAEQGIDWFYKGEFAASTEAWMKDHAGLITAQDFAQYQIKSREPIRTTYRGYEIVGFPPPSSGGVHVAEILNILESFHLDDAQSPNTVHTMAEAMKLAFADRAFWLGDPDFVAVPKGLISSNYAKTLAREIRLDHTIPVPRYHTPENAQTDLFGKHTTHFATADAEGNWVACTATVNTTFGSKVIIPDTGIVLNNQMDDFSIQPGAPNYFGLVGAEANSVAPGKRPLSSMSPTIVLKNGKPILSVGAAGGPTIISQTVLAIVNTIDFKMDLNSALAQTRFHQQWIPDELKIETSASTNLWRELSQRGHHLIGINSMGAAQAIAVAPNGIDLVGAHDPRLNGKAVGW